MTPMPNNPRVVIQINNLGEVVAAASNISAELDITYTETADAFNDAALGLSFNSTRQAAVIES